MAKRSLCILLAVVTLFSLAVPAFAEEAPAASGVCGANVEWSMSSDGVLTISGEGAMEDYQSGTSPWYDVRTQFTSVVIQSGVTSIGSYAVFNCLSLADVTIPEGVTSIGSSAFNQCHSLTSVTIPKSVTSIGHEVFLYCFNLTSINVESGNPCYTSVDGVLFDADKATILAVPGGKSGSYIIPEDVTSVGDYAFIFCQILTNVTIPESVVNIGTSAFVGCSSLIDITIPGSVTSIGDHAFSNCSLLENVTIQEGVTSIKDRAFASCVSLKSVTIPESVASIGDYAFSSCNLTNITILNPNCVIGSIGASESTAIAGYDGSTAQDYAEANGHAFTSLGPAPTPEPTATPEPTPEPTAEPTPEPTAAPAPTGSGQLAAPKVTISKASNGIQVSWNKVEGSPRYMVYYKENGGSWKRIGTTTATTYTRAASKLKNGATYQFTVRCCKNDKKTLLSPYTASNSLKYTK